MAEERFRTLVVAIVAPVLFGLGGCSTAHIGTGPELPDYQPTEISKRPTSQKPAPVRTEVTRRNGNRITTILSPDTGAIQSTKNSKAARAEDLLTRIQAGFRLDIHHEDTRVQREYDWFARHRDYMLRCFRRAEPYLHHIVESLESRGMPLELALLPVVESAFNPYAYSPSHASGMWQFIGSTGRNYGLKQNDWYDGRRDVLASTRAAMDYLQKLENQFDGDWLLALAAYNSGEGRVARVSRRNQQRGLPGDFWNLDLPRETEAYVPKLLGVARLIAESPDWLPEIPDQPYFAVVDHDRQVAIGDVARLAGISMEEMYRLNPGYSRWATPPEGPHYFLIPRDHAAQLPQQLTALPAHTTVQELSHRVRSGDTLSEIAARYGTDVASLKRMNGLSGSRIRVGQQLTVNSQQPVLADGTVVAANNPNVRSRSRRSRSRTTYTVRNGDNLWSIARRYRIGVRELAAWNGLRVSSILRPGKKLRIRRVNTAPSTAVAKAGGSRKLRYTVRGGDSLWTIARAHRVSVADIRRWNTIGGSFLKPGQTLTLFLNR